MDSILIPAIIAALVLGLGFLILLYRRTGGESRLSRIERNLESFSQTQTALHGQISAQLQNQERELGRTLNERLDAVGLRVGESLVKNAEKNEAQLSALRERLAVIDAAQRNIADLSQQVVGLQDILSNKQARGKFGEEQLETIVRDQLPAGYCAFQATLGNGKRADCLITMPPPTGAFAIDAKFPLESYRALSAAGEDQAERDRWRKTFAADIGKHIADIGEKYIIPGETADAAFMFVPSEAIYAEIHTDHPALIDKARKNRVFIVSPTTLWAVLTTMRAVIKDQRMREQAGLIQKEVEVLLKDTQRITDRIGKLRQHFNLADRDIRDIEISNGKITNRGERIVGLELDQSPSLPADGAGGGADGGPEDSNVTPIPQAGRG